MSDLKPGSKTLRAIDIKLFPIALVLIISATAIPVEFRYPSIDYISWRLGFIDVLNNILLYIPLGVALRRKRLSFIILTSALLTCLVEIIQLISPERHPSLIDITANILGGIAGWHLANIYHSLNMPLPRPATVRVFLLISSVMVMFIFSVIISQPGQDADFSNWDPSYWITVNNELTRDRPWSGTVYGLWLFDRALSHSSLLTLSTAFPEPSGLGKSGIEIKPTFSLIPPRISEKEYGKPILPAAQEKQICDTLMKSGAMTLVVWFHTNSLEQFDSARIVTFSKDQYHRNFTLGQEGGRIVFRLRTPATGLNGFDPPLQTPKVLKTGESLFVAASYDGKISRVYLNGHLVGRLNIAAKRKFGTTLLDYDVPLVATLSGVSTAIFFLSLIGPMSNRLFMWVIAGASGFCGVFFIETMGGLSALPGFENWAMLLGIGGGICVASAIHKWDILPG